MLILLKTWTLGRALGLREDHQSYFWPLSSSVCSSHSTVTASAEEIGLATAIILARPVPVTVEGVVLLSVGGDAVKFLNAVNVVANKVPANSPLSPLPHLIFSFGRGLQGDSMQK
ncbi:hypothetical protein BDR03DRAFT_362325 [Suillus americanus]|nr:hypothetical protein BDR03DRAFT_362325 [Suillus americanus]